MASNIASMRNVLARTRRARLGWWSCGFGVIFAIVISVCHPTISVAQEPTYTVAGTLRTPTGTNVFANDVPVKYIRVLVMDEDPLFDDTEATTHTGIDGSFSVSFTDTSEEPDIYIDVEYVGTGVSGRFVEVRADGLLAFSPIRDNNVEGIVHTDIPAGTLSLGTLRVNGTRANIVSQIGDAIRFLDTQDPTWTMPDDVIVEARTTNDGSYVEGDGSRISIEFQDYDHPGSGSAAFSDIHHEFFHWSAYRAYGNRWPDYNCSLPSHSIDTESCEGFAVMEGAAEYFAGVSAPLDNKNAPPPSGTWRGADGTGSNNSGEIVEGALDRTWRLTGDISGVLQSLLSDASDNMAEFRDSYATRRGTTSTAMNIFLDYASANGIVYTRGVLEGFQATSPDSGGFIVFGGKSFVRGSVNVSVRLATRDELNLGPNSGIVAATEKDLGYKPAVPGLGENSLSGFTYLGAVGFGSDRAWDTTALADGEYDLVARVRSAHSWLDSFLPDFAGDSNASTDSNEKWLKTLGTWYNSDNMPDGDDEGMITVDNTPPSCSGPETGNVLTVGVRDEGSGLREIIVTAVDNVEYQGIELAIGDAIGGVTEGQTSEFQFEIRQYDVTRPGTVTFQIEDIAGNSGTCTRQIRSSALDLVFAIDTTGSMWDDIAFVRASAADIVSSVADSGSDYRIGVVAYRDFPVYPYGSSGDYSSRIFLPFSTDESAIIAAVNSLAVGGGADWRESVYSGLMAGVGFPWRDNVKKAIILMGDAPPHDPEPFTGYTLSSVVAAANAVDPASIYPIFIGYDSYTQSIFQQLADGTGGETFEASAASDVVEALLQALETILESPVADAGGPYTAGIGEAITFDGSASYDPDGNLVLYEWDFESDGVFDVSSSAPYTDYAYPTEFLGEVTLRVTDISGLSGSDRAAVEVVAEVNRPPTSDPGGPYTATEGAEIVLEGTGSFDPDGDELVYRWDFGDGTTGIGPIVSHVYADNGSHAVNLMVIDSQGMENVQATVALISNVAPVVEAGLDHTIPEGETLALSEVTFVDPGFDFPPAGTTEDFVATVDWGDGSMDDGLVAEVALPEAVAEQKPITEAYLLESEGTVYGTHRYEDNGIYPVTITVCDDDGGCGVDSFQVEVSNLSPTVSADLTDQSVQSSDAIADVTITGTDVAADILTASASWSVNGGEFSAGLPNGFVLANGGCGVTDTTNSCFWTLSGFADIPSGVYTVRLSIADDDGDETELDIDIIASPEDALLHFHGGNPVALPIIEGADVSGPFGLTVDIQEKVPDVGVGPLPGDVSLTEIRVQLTPIGPGGEVIGICATDWVDGTGYDAVKRISCSFDAVPVNTYAVSVTDDNGYYVALAEDVLTVYDPDSRYASGGGTFSWPETNEETDFGFTMEYNKKATNLQGSLMLVRHTEDGSVYYIKSNALYGMSMGRDTNFSWVSFSGKTVYLDPSWLEPEGNHEFVAYVEDAATDRFWISVKGKDRVVIPEMSLELPTSANAVALTEGEVIVP